MDHPAQLWCPAPTALTRRQHLYAAAADQHHGRSDTGAGGSTTDLLGLRDIARLLGVAQGTPQRWRTRGLLPDPEAVVAGRPVWRRGAILAWHEARDARPGPKRT